MVALRRKTTIRGRPMKPLELNVMCDKCGHSRAHGKHDICSKQRQAEAAERRAREQS